MMAHLFLMGKQQQQQQRVVLLLLVAMMMMMMILFQEVSLVEAAAARPLIGMRMGMGIGGGGGRGSGHNMIKMFETLGIRSCKCCIINNNIAAGGNHDQVLGGGGGGKSGDHEYYSCKTIYISDQHMTSTATISSTSDCPKLDCLPWKL